jgi:type IV secretion system protein VirB11
MSIYLETCLAPIARYLARPDTTDVLINRPGEIWLESLGLPPCRIEVPELSGALMQRLARQIAAINAQGINREHPLLSGSLPTGERVQIAMPPATRGEIAFAIRKHVMTDLGLDDYEAGGALDHVRFPSDREKTKTDFRFDRGDATVKQLLRQAVIERKNILVSGGTSSGKTTFLNALIREIPSEERLIFIEDTPELRFVHENSVGLIAPRGGLGETNVSVEDLLIAALRMRPDRVILGEMRGTEALTFLRAINTGHPGSFSTIHADSPERALDQLTLLVLQANIGLSWDDTLRYIRNSIDVVVQLERRNGIRRISSVLQPSPS